MTRALLKKIYSLQNLNFLQDCSLKVGILGGSFYPAHYGHLQISLEALKSHNLDYVIWLVALQNPFKENYTQDIFQRAHFANKLVTHPRILVSTAEYDLQTNYSYQVFESFTRKFNNVNFTWLMGADNLKNFHKWRKAYLLPLLWNIIIFDRVGYSNLLTQSSLKSYIRVGNNIDSLAKKNIIISRKIKLDISSTKIRKLNKLNIKYYDDSNG